MSSELGRHTSFKTNMWRRVARRRYEVIELLSQLGCTTASELARRLGVSHMQAAYTLNLLEREGRAVRYRAGRIHVWCASPVSSVGEAYAVISPCFKYAEAALKKLLEGARGSIYMLAPSDLVKAMAELYRRDCVSGKAHLLAAAKMWLEGRLDGAVIGVRRRSDKQMQFIIDVKKAKERLAAADHAAQA